jgi:large subunit ribosomal protein L15
MRLNDLKPDPGSRPKKMRKGRGLGSGKGRTSTRGTKGQRARNGVRVGFEGGQTPIQRRLPMGRGQGIGRTANKHPRLEYVPVNLGQLAQFDGSETVTPESLMQANLVRNPEDRIKILGDGELKVALTIQAHAFSKSAQEKIQAAGGTAETI